MVKYGIMKEYGEGEWSINLGRAEYEDVGGEMTLIDAMNEVAKRGWQVISVYVEDDRTKCAVRHDDYNE